MKAGPPSRSLASSRSSSKIKSPDQLRRILAKLPAARRKGVVFTNGCFDLLHRGHVTYLRSARKLGQVLIVALNDDASTRRLKGPSRPINTLADRLEVMAALEMVDYVTWFEEDTPREIILKLRPHVLVKGGDYRTSEIVGGPEVESWGGSVRPLELVRGKSTTEILKRAKK